MFLAPRPVIGTPRHGSRNPGVSSFTSSLSIPLASPFRKSPEALSFCTSILSFPLRRLSFVYHGRLAHTPSSTLHCSIAAGLHPKKLLFLSLSSTRRELHCGNGFQTVLSVAFGVPLRPLHHGQLGECYACADMDILQSYERHMSP